MLCVPHSSSDLILVHRFANDNNSIFIFYSSDFCIKDKAMEKMLFRGQSENDLYPFPICRLSSNSIKVITAAYVGDRVSASI